MDDLWIKGEIDGVSKVLPLIIVQDAFRKPVLGRVWIDDLWPLWMISIFSNKLEYSLTTIAQITDSREELTNKILQRKSSVYRRH